jgi:LacI family transcriptional regulator
MRLLGERACSRLLQRIADPSLPPRTERLPAELVIRESCGCLPIPAQVSGHGYDTARPASGGRLP